MDRFEKNKRMKKIRPVKKISYDWLINYIKDKITLNIYKIIKDRIIRDILTLFEIDEEEKE